MLPRRSVCCSLSESPLHFATVIACSSLPATIRPSSTRMPHPCVAGMRSLYLTRPRARNGKNNATCLPTIYQTMATLALSLGCALRAAVHPTILSETTSSQVIIERNEPAAFTTHHSPNAAMCLIAGHSQGFGLWGARSRAIFRTSAVQQRRFLLCYSTKRETEERWHQTHRTRQQRMSRLLSTIFTLHFASFQFNPISPNIASH